MKDQAVYNILVKGHLSAQWDNWFSGMNMLQVNKNETCLSGLIVDQPALHGILNRIRDLGLVLISVERFEIKQSTESPLDLKKNNSQGFHASK